MASLRTIRNKIKSTRNTQKITKAMKMVAAAKLRRAQDAVVRARPYAQLIDEMLASLSRGRAEAELPPHPLMHQRPVRRVEVLLLTSDRGLCGGFNANVIRRGQRFLVEEGAALESVQFSTVGRRGRDFAKKKGLASRKDYAGFFGKLRFGNAKEIADDLIHAYLEGELDAVYLLYNEFKSAITQRISLKQLLPIVPQASVEPVDPKVLQPVPHLYEPPRPQVLGRLTLDYNRARQAAITKELMEIVSGAEALK
jgi:F-type H+-transporting ATPase subunit gamma